MTTIDLGELTVLPCGRYCGVHYQMAGLVEPVEVQREALNNGWKIQDVDGVDCIVCPSCAQLRTTSSQPFGPEDAEVISTMTKDEVIQALRDAGIDVKEVEV